MSLETPKQSDALEGRLGAFVAPSRIELHYWTNIPASAILTVMAKRRTKRLSEQVRQAIDESGLTRYRIAQETGIDESALSKFYNGQRGINTDTLDRLGECLELEITKRKPAKRKGR